MNIYLFDAHHQFIDPKNKNEESVLVNSEKSKTEILSLEDVEEEGRPDQR